jgi:hypothetical protein
VNFEKEKKVGLARMMRGSPFADIARSRIKAKGDEERPEDETEEEEDDEQDENKKSKKKKKAEDDQDEKDEDEPDARAARSREKARIATIMNCPAAKRFPGAALRLALDTSVPRHAAVGALTAMNSDLRGNGGSLDDRMAGLRNPDIGPDEGSTYDSGAVEAQVHRILAAGKKARGEA